MADLHSLRKSQYWSRKGIIKTLTCGRLHVVPYNQSSLSYGAQVLALAHSVLVIQRSITFGYHGSIFLLLFFLPNADLDPWHSRTITVYPLYFPELLAVFLPEVRALMRLGEDHEKR